MLNLIDQKLDKDKVIKQLTLKHTFFPSEEKNEYKKLLYYYEYINEYPNNAVGFILDMENIQAVKIKSTYDILKELQHRDDIYVIGRYLPFLTRQIPEFDLLKASPIPIQDKYPEVYKLADSIVTDISNNTTLDLAKIYKDTDKLSNNSVNNYLIDNFTKILLKKYPELAQDEFLLKFHGYVSNKSTALFALQYIYNRGLKYAQRFN